MKSRNAEPTTQQLFLFVNKDSKSKSLSKSEGLSAKEINRHAQQVRNRRLAAQKATTAHKSSSSARRIALGGWKKREGETGYVIVSVWQRGTNSTKKSHPRCRLASIPFSRVCFQSPRRRSSSYALHIGWLGPFIALIDKSPGDHSCRPRAQ